MDYALKERIGKPELFTGRKDELAYFLKWIDDIKEEKSQSTALLSRRKTGKTALLERLFNIAFSKNNGVIPFYYEIKEVKMWIGDFCVDFFLTFIYQYIAFKSRKTDYMGKHKRKSLIQVKQAAIDEGMDYLAGIIEDVEYTFSHDHVDLLWETVREAPKIIANSENEFIVQMIDEFQFLNTMIYLDKEKSEGKVADTLVGGYLSTAESKIAPLLVSGSWVGWLMSQLIMMPARFKYKSLKNMTEPEAVEMAFKYSRFFEVPVTEEIAYLLVELSEGNPFYISAVIRSEYPHKNLTTVDGLTGTLEFETLDDHGIIKTTWMEYMSRAFPQINDQNAKNIVLHLSKHRHREFTRQELLEGLKLEMPDKELEKKLKALVKADIVNQGTSNYRYRGVNDSIFDKVFRGVYQEEIREFDASMIKKEYSEELRKMETQYKKLLGKYHYQKN